MVQSLSDRALRQGEPDDIGEVPEAFRGERLGPLLGNARDGGEAAERVSFLQRRTSSLDGCAARVACRDPAFERLPARRASRLIGSQDRVAPRTHRSCRPEPADETSAPHRERSSPSRLKRCFVIISGRKPPEYFRPSPSGSPSYRPVVGRRRPCGGRTWKRSWHRSPCPRAPSGSHGLSIEFARVRRTSSPTLASRSRTAGTSSPTLRLGLARPRSPWSRPSSTSSARTSSSYS